MDNERKSLEGTKFYDVVTSHLAQKPSIPITSKYFKYVPSFNTDIRKTFAKVREEQRRAREKTNLWQLQHHDDPENPHV